MLYLYRSIVYIHLYLTICAIDGMMSIQSAYILIQHGIATNYKTQINHKTVGGGDSPKTIYIYHSACAQFWIATKKKPLHTHTQQPHIVRAANVLQVYIIYSSRRQEKERRIANKMEQHIVRLYYTIHNTTTRQQPCQQQRQHIYTAATGSIAQTHTHTQRYTATIMLAVVCVCVWVCVCVKYLQTAATPQPNRIIIAPNRAALCCACSVRARCYVQHTLDPESGNSLQAQPRYIYIYTRYIL